MASRFKKLLPNNKFDSKFIRFQEVGFKNRKINFNKRNTYNILKQHVEGLYKLRLEDSCEDQSFEEICQDKHTEIDHFDFEEEEKLIKIHTFEIEEELIEQSDNNLIQNSSFTNLCEDQSFEEIHQDKHTEIDHSDLE